MFNFIKRIFGFGRGYECSGSQCHQPHDERVINDNNYPVLGDLLYCEGTPEEWKKVQAAISFANTLFKYPDFKETFIGLKIYETQGLTNAQVFEKLSEFVIPVRVKIFDRTRWQIFWRTEGYEKGDGYIYVSRHMLENVTKLASLIMHEASHYAGFTHYIKATKYQSVPYSINKAVEIIINKPLNLGVSHERKK